ncbi:MAG: hypothetical protein ACK4IT_01200 [Thioalkalivibrionaceae bacterium]
MAFRFAADLLRFMTIVFLCNVVVVGLGGGGEHLQMVSVANWC